MPNPEKFLRGFGIHRGLTLGPYVLDDIKIEHVSDVRYRVYEYPMELTFKLGHSHTNSKHPDQLEQELLDDLENYTEGTRIIYTSYHNPYRCDFGHPYIYQSSPDASTVIIRSDGKGVRIYTS